MDQWLFNNSHCEACLKWTWYSLDNATAGAYINKMGGTELHKEEYQSRLLDAFRTAIS